MKGNHSQWIERLDKDGYVVVKNFFDKDLVAQARKDVEALYDLDRAERARVDKKNEVTFNSQLSQSILTAPSHLLLNLMGKSPALDHLYEKILTHSESSQAIKALVGNLKLRDMNCRLMTGTYDTGDFLNPPHEYHRDARGEVCIGIFLNEVPPGDNAATALVPGSHKYPIDPRWDVTLGAPLYHTRTRTSHHSFLARLNPIGRLLHRKLLKNQTTGAFGEPGDFYIFINDVWHGRVPNVNGHKAMIIMMGAFSTEFTFPDKGEPLPEEVIRKMPPTLAAGFARTASLNKTENTLIHKMLNDRIRATPLNIFWWAKLERGLINKISLCFRGGQLLRLRLGPIYHLFKYKLGRIGPFLKKIQSQPGQIVRRVLPQSVKTRLRKAMSGNK